MNTILVIEDDPIDLISIKAKIKELGYNDPVVSDYNRDLYLLIQKVNPDLIISDVYFENKPHGLELIDISDALVKPLILITADTRKEIFDLANKLHKVTYMVKPFHHLTLQSCIDMVMKDTNAIIPFDDKFCYVRDYTGRKVKLNYSGILFIKADGNFCHIQCMTEHYMIRISLAKFSQELDSGFVRVHKSFIVNKKYVESITSNYLIVVKQEIPIGRKYRHSVTGLFQVIK